MQLWKLFYLNTKKYFLFNFKTIFVLMILYFQSILQINLKVAQFFVLFYKQKFGNRN